ncbi:DUF1642 domain-containing protein [Levilactobacillus brevis]|uniref:DUF1642 domain-containing protein n=1 Tax=Levilactobacillus brevis TaxID=1580 RepID=UPI000BE7E7B8|nr:DUF1642 domain-containing protein [Levilactobacillus brevis]MCZ2118618.1 DUF1642 domain-containing protein [Levilactobacillus brevis]MCZ2124198.1 DUF1642 domain-containing protein [Levilactobacillus brevis]MCZ2208518.1 DUF1642 domain-containing protein [Levilactobacillus brevis]MCZ2323982.1 DUF1642 domain-containing protein [Levilactobacillus brevis]
MIKTYRKTTTIKAEQFDEAKWQSIYNASHNPEEWDFEARKLGIDHYHGYFIILTYEGDMRVHDGDWIATGINGENWPIADDIFRKTYAELPVIPEAVADWIELGKSKRVSLDTALLLTLYENKKTDGNELARWIMHGNLATVARAWLDGYRVEAQHDTRTD